MSERPLDPIECASVFLQVARTFDQTEPGSTDAMMVADDGVVTRVDINTLVETPGDLRALGLSMWRTLAGQHRDPSGRATTAQLPSDVPPALVEIVHGLTRAPTDKRLNDVRAVIHLLTQFLDTAVKLDWVLIAESDPQRGPAIVDMVRRFELQPALCRDGTDALAIAACRADAPCLIISSLTLPAIDGVTVIRRISQQHDGEPTPAIIIGDFPRLLENARTALIDEGIPCAVAPAGRKSALRAKIAERLGRSASRQPLTHIASVLPLAQREVMTAQRVEAMALLPRPSYDPDLNACLAQTCRATGLPIGIISVVRGIQEHFLAHHGLTGALESQRGCLTSDGVNGSVIASGVPLNVNDASQYPGVATLGLIADGPIGGFISVPLTSPSGVSFGALCLASLSARTSHQVEIDVATVVARWVAGHLHLAAPSALQDQDMHVLTGLEPNARLSQLDLNDAPWPDRAIYLFNDAGRVVQTSRGAPTSLERPLDSLIGLTRDEVLDLVRIAYQGNSTFRSAVRVDVRHPYAACGLVDVGNSERLIQWSAWPRLFRQGRFQFETFTPHAVVASDPSMLHGAMAPSWRRTPEPTTQ